MSASCPNCNSTLSVDLGELLISLLMTAEIPCGEFTRSFCISSED
jgi:hypothetical protein